MAHKVELAKNPDNGRWYRVSMMQMRYFPIAKAEALAMLEDGRGFEGPYIPFSRPDLWHAYNESQKALAAAIATTTEAQA